MGGVPFSSPYPGGGGMLLEKKALALLISGKYSQYLGGLIGGVIPSRSWNPKTVRLMRLVILGVHTHVDFSLLWNPKMGLCSHVGSSLLMRPEKVGVV